MVGCSHIRRGQKRNSRKKQSAPQGPWHFSLSIAWICGQTYYLNHGIRVCRMLIYVGTGRKDAFLGVVNLLKTRTVERNCTWSVSLWQQSCSNWRILCGKSKAEEWHLWYRVMHIPSRLVLAGAWPGMAMVWGSALLIASWVLQRWAPHVPDLRCADDALLTPMPTSLQRAALSSSWRFLRQVPDLERNPSSVRTVTSSNFDLGFPAVPNQETFRTSLIWGDPLNSTSRRHSKLVET